VEVGPPAEPAPEARPGRRAVPRALATKRVERLEAAEAGFAPTEARLEPLPTRERAVPMLAQPEAPPAGAAALPRNRC
jgi:hypothetical protein